MGKCKNKPVERDYFEYTDLMKSLKFNQIESWVGDLPQKSFGCTNLQDVIGLYNENCDVRLNYRKNMFYIITLEGFHKMTFADVLIKGVDGELYPCKIDKFIKTYDIIG